MTLRSIYSFDVGSDCTLWVCGTGEDAGVPDIDAHGDSGRRKQPAFVLLEEHGFHGERFPKGDMCPLLRLHAHFQLRARQEGYIYRRGIYARWKHYSKFCCFYILLFFSVAQREINCLVRSGPGFDPR